MDRYLIAAALLLLVLEVAYLVTGLEGDPSDRDAMATAASSVRPLGEVLRTEKSVRRRGQNTLVWSESKADDTVFEYDSVLTLAGSAARIRLAGDTTLTLEENTLVVLEPPRSDDDGRLRIRFSKGSVRSSNPDRKVDFNSESFVLSADKGASLSLVGLEDGRFAVEVEKGKASLTTGGKSEALEEGAKLLLKGDEIQERKSLSAVLRWSPDVPRRIYAREFPVEVGLRWEGTARELAVVDPAKKLSSNPVSGNEVNVKLAEGTHLLSLANGTESSETIVMQVRVAPTARYFTPLPRDRVRAGEDVVFGWEAIPGARRYQIEVAPSPQFERIEAKAETKDLQVKLKLSRAGAFHWRVVGYDDEEIAIPPARSYPLFVSPDLMQSPELNAPEIRSPADETSKGASPGASMLFKLLLPEAKAQSAFDAVFTWKTTAGADHYVIEISKTPGFEEPVVIEKVGQPSFTWKKVVSGRYFWRVAAGKSAGGGEGDRMGAFSTVAVAQLDGAGTSSGDGVRVVERIDPASSAKKVETAQAPKPTPVQTPEPDPARAADEESEDLGLAARDLSPSEVARVAIEEAPGRRSGRFFYRPQWRSTSLRSGPSLSGSFDGPVGLAFGLDLPILTLETGRLELKGNYERVQWKPKALATQSELNETRWSASLQFRPKGQRWAAGLGVESVPFLERKRLEESELSAVTLIGPSVQFTNSWESSDVEIDFDLRRGDALWGARLTATVSYRLSMLSIGPRARYEIFQGFNEDQGEDRQLRGWSGGLQIGLGW